MNGYRRGYSDAQRSVIPKRNLGQARAALKHHMQQQEDEPLNSRFGPPDISFYPEEHGVPRDLADKFWEIMLKEGVIVKHPYGGFMHPRFAEDKFVFPTKEEAGDEVKKLLDGNPSSVMRSSCVEIPVTFSPP